MRRLWVAELLASPKTVAKVLNLHDINLDELRDVLVCVRALVFVWDVDVDRGERAIVSVTIRGRPVLVSLYDAKHPLGDVYHLGSAYFVD